MTLRLGCSHCERIATHADLCDKRRTPFVAEKRCFWVGEMKKLPSEHGDQSIKDQPQTVWGEEEEWRDALISVVPVLTLMATRCRPGASSRALFRLDFFSPRSALQRRKKSILGQEHHFRIEVAVRDCHLVTFVRHCTFKPSFFSPFPSLPQPIVWIPLVTFYVAIWKLEGKRSSARASLWNQLVDRFSIYFCLTTPILLFHFIFLSL